MEQAWTEQSEGPGWPLTGNIDPLRQVCLDHHDPVASLCEAELLEDVQEPARAGLEVYMVLSCWLDAPR